MCTQSHENRSNQTDLVSFEGSRSVSNSWSCSIGFAADVVSGGVGFKDYDCATYWPLWFNWEYGSGSATDWNGYHTISWDVPL